MTNELTLKDKAINLQRLLDARMTQIARSLPPGTMTADHFARVVLTLCQRTPKLMECNIATLLGSVMQAAQLGLSPDPVLGEAWFVPYKGIVQFQAGYKGLIKLAWQSDQIAKISARVVRKGDVFDYEYGLKEKLVHKPLSPPSSPLTHVYAIAKIKGGENNFLVMTRDEVDAVKARSPAARSGASPWQSDFDPMAQKTSLRRLCKTLPTGLSPPLQKTLALDELAEHGLKQNLGADFAEFGEKDPEESIDEKDIADGALAAEIKAKEEKNG